METTGHDTISFFFFFHLKKDGKQRQRPLFSLKKNIRKRKRKNYGNDGPWINFIYFSLLFSNLLNFSFFHFFKKSILLIEIIIILVGAIVYFLFKFIFRKY